MAVWPAAGRVGRRLKQLGIELPIAPRPLGSYVPAKQVGHLVTTAGQVSMLGGREYKGQLGRDLTADEAREATRACAINCLAALLTVIDTLDRVKQIVSVHGFLNSAPGFEGQATAMNGASDLMAEVFGEIGLHTRTAIGVAALPGNFAAEVYILVEVE
jgi:enamine deaminase RidA (YjgF/YER057c/UK114 family)